jgi:hypothetical protein
MQACIFAISYYLYIFKIFILERIQNLAFDPSYGRK